MRVTQKLKAWLVAEKLIQEDATDEECKEGAAKAMVEGKLTGEKFVALSKDPDAERALALDAKLDKMADVLEKAVGALTARRKQDEDLLKPKPGDEGEEKAEEVVCPECGWKGPLPGDGKCPNCGAEIVAGKAVEVYPTGKPKIPPQPQGTAGASPKSVVKAGGSRLAKLFRIGGSLDDWSDARVKEAAEMYSDTKSAMVHQERTRGGRLNPLAGQPVRDFTGEGRTLMSPSDRDKAIVGAWGQFLCQTARVRSKTIAWAQMPQHQKELILHAMENMDWGGSTEGGDYHDIDRRKLAGLEQKALIDDATSGGVEAVPIVFDDMIVATPILNGEFFPLVNQIPLDRGRRIQGARAGIVTSEWGGIDDTAVTLFNTASYVSAFDTTVYRWQGSIWIGLDFLSDTPIDFAQFLTEQYGDVFLAEMDKVVCVGNGTTQPEGVMTKAATSAVTFAGTTTIGGYESLRFGVHKREHLPNLVKTAVFGGTDTSWQRACAIPVGAADARRLFSVNQIGNYDGYTLMGRPYKVSTAMTNQQLFYAILGRYRMYRRRGFTIKNSMEGDTLLRRNELLMVCMARYGGQLERGACAAITTDAPA